MTPWEKFKAFCYKWIGGLFLEDKNGVLVVSLGRVSFLIVLGWMLAFWSRWYFADSHAGAELPPGIIEVFYTLAAYVFGSKITDVLRAKIVPKLPVSGAKTDGAELFEPTENAP